MAESVRGAIPGKGQPVLSVRDISVRFAGIHAVSEISFDLHPGETLAVIGPNGAGKTTLVNAITGAVMAQSGTAKLGAAGVELINRRPDLIVGLGLIRTFQNVLLIPHLTVRENVLIGRYVHQRSGILANMLGTQKSRSEERAHRVRVDEILDSMGLLGMADANVTKLAYGLRKRVELARALAREPSVLLLDEPVAGMSIEEREQMAEYVRVAQRSSSELAILLIEHDMRFVMSLADRVMAMNQGTLLAVGSPEEIQVHPLVLEAYLGPSDD